MIDKIMCYEKISAILKIRIAILIMIWLQFLDLITSDRNKAKTISLNNYIEKESGYCWS